MPPADSLVFFPISVRFSAASTYSDLKVWYAQGHSSALSLCQLNCAIKLSNYFNPMIFLNFGFLSAKTSFLYFVFTYCENYWCRLLTSFPWEVELLPSSPRGQFDYTELPSCVNDTQSVIIGCEFLVHFQSKFSVVSKFNDWNNFEIEDDGLAILLF